jgi:hypothetical protein
MIPSSSIEAIFEQQDAAFLLAKKREEPRV